MRIVEINHSVLLVHGVQVFLSIQKFFVLVPNTNKERVLN